MKMKFPFLMSRSPVSAAAAITLAAFLIYHPSARATSETWTGTPGDGVTWSATGNWSNGIITGTTGATTNTDTATFSTTSGTTITVDAGRNLQTITFTGNVGSFTLSSGSFVLTNGGTIQIAAAATSTGVTETINTPLVLAGAGYTITNLAPTASLDLLNIGGNITNIASSGTSTLTLAGTTGTNANTIGGIISDNGVTAATGVTKSGASTWVLSAPC